MEPLDYAALEFRAGLEVHYQLLTKRKLFCRCPAGRYSAECDAEVLRHMRPTLSELGEYDGTALMEFKTRKNVIYQIRNDSVCTYEMDDTPPFPPDPEAVDIALEAALLFRCAVVGEIHITRKQYLDGSIPTGFQRTAIVGVEGRIPLPGGEREVPVVQVSFEEDSCREVRDAGHQIVFRTDRLGMPLVEIVTHPEMRSPEELAEVGRRIGQLLRSTGKVRRGLGSVRQDVNVSIAGAPRIEIKGVPKIGLFVPLTRNEARRQKGLLDLREDLRRRGIAAGDVAARAVPLPVDGGEHPALRRAREAGGEVWAVRVPGFAGAMSWPLQEAPGDAAVPFLRDVAGRVRVIACLEAAPYVFCREAADPRYPERLEAADWERAAKAAGAGGDDALMVVCGPRRDLQTAAQEIGARCREAAEGIPQETRQALPDGTTDFERILPGPDRMYPDTDLPLIPVEDERLRRIEAAMPDPPWEREARYRGWGLPEDVVEALAASPRGRLLDRLVAEAGADPRLAGTALVQTVRALGRRGVNAGKIPDAEWLALFESLGRGELAREALPGLLGALAARPGLTARQAIEEAALGPLSEEALARAVEEVIAAHGEDPMHRPTEANRLAYLMGPLMARVRGRRGGREVRAALEARWRAMKPTSTSP